MLSVRGATTIAYNSEAEIKKTSLELFEEMIKQNDINVDDITSIFFSCTQDITKAYPGKYVREAFNLNRTAIMHFNEMHVEGSLKLCIRVLILLDIKEKKDIKYIYLNEAKNLRKDLFDIK